MVYEAAAAVAARDQSQLRSREEDKRCGRSRQQQALQEEEEKVSMRCGVLGILRRVLLRSKASPSSEKK
jgi:hypothetical protein